VQVTLYGRNGLATDIWAAVNVAADPPITVGFHRLDVGVACWTAPTNATVVLLDHDPALGGASIVETVGTVTVGRPMWLDVAGDGSVRAGVGVPGWWPGNGVGDCPG